MNELYFFSLATIVTVMDDRKTKCYKIRDRMIRRIKMAIFDAANDCTVYILDSISVAATVRTENTLYCFFLPRETIWLWTKKTPGKGLKYCYPAAVSVHQGCSLFPFRLGLKKKYNPHIKKIWTCSLRGMSINN